jgi:hypothetical protein
VDKEVEIQTTHHHRGADSGEHGVVEKFDDGGWSLNLVTVILRLGRAAVIFALCLSLGGHWLALQSLAWTTMLVSNARHNSLTQAVEKTFDGAHPCDLCHAVMAGKKSEKNSEMLPLIAKLDLICPPAVRPWRPPAAPYAYAAAVFRIVERAQSPLVPPPRSLPG